MSKDISGSKTLGGQYGDFVGYKIIKEMQHLILSTRGMGYSGYVPGQHLAIISGPSVLQLNLNNLTYMLAQNTMEINIGNGS